MNKALRVVFDTNVVLSALVFGKGRLAPIRDTWHRGACAPLVSSVTAGELIRALAYPKFGLSADDQSELLADYLPWCTTVRIPAVPPKVLACRDPFDVPFLQLAVLGKADYLVTGDQDLLALASNFVRPIIPVDRFFAVLAEI